MKIIHTGEEMKGASRLFKQSSRSIGLVPTMGALHEGHLSLIRESVKTMDMTVASLFVNPAQFAPHEDFESYPRDHDRDMTLFRKEGVDIVFMPDNREIYPPGYQTYVEVTGWKEIMGGNAKRRLHGGVCTVVLKLFNIIHPDRAFFGQKDAQQGIIIKRMVQDLDLDIHIKMLPIIREKDGLALSSRNVYLTEKQRNAALSLSQSLTAAENFVKRGEVNARIIKAHMKSIIDTHPDVKIDYIDIVETESLESQEIIHSGDLIALAVFIGKTRLIDNTVLKF